MAGCFSALDPADLNKPENPEPTAFKADLLASYEKLNISTTRPETSPLLLVHYMPWYKAPTSKIAENNLAAYGGHWTGWGKINPTEAKANGQAKIYAHQYPLTGPYDSADANLLEYQAALMKIAGIDGVIFDWYGSKDALDYGEIHAAAKAMVAVLKRASLKFAVCYEDQTVKHMIESKVISEADALKTGKEVFKWLQDNWFTDPAYVKYEGRPVVLCFGPQYFDQQQWQEMFAQADPAPYFADLSNRTAWASTTYNWPAMNGNKSASQLLGDLNSFYAKVKNKASLVATAFPAFDDVYEDTGGTSYGNLEYADGETFKFTFYAAEKSNPDIIQIATWNDYGEGTIIEPTIERGYRELEYLQDRQRELDADASFPYTKEDLRLPLELFKLRYLDPNTAKKADIAAAYSALFAGDAAGFRARAAGTGVSVGMSELRPLLRN